MDIKVDDQKIDYRVFQVPLINFGQAKRWRNFKPLNYTVRMKLEDFILKIDSLFSEFRKSEIEDDDVEGFEELTTYKSIGRPSLRELSKNHLENLYDLIIYNEHDILHSITYTPMPPCDFYYSANSINKILIQNGFIDIMGICFMVYSKNDY